MKQDNDMHKMAQMAVKSEIENLLADFTAGQSPKNSKGGGESKIDVKKRSQTVKPKKK